MTFSDMSTPSSKSLRCSSVGNELNKPNQQGKLKRLNTSILNLISRSQQTNYSDKLHTHEQLQKQELFLQPPTDLSRSVSNKSVTFALVFDEMDILMKESEDLILVVPNKCVTEEKDTNIEPYPFRSEVSPDSLIKSNSSTNIIDIYQPKKKFLNFNRPKKLRHPIVEISSINRSTSVPIMFNSPSIINEQQTSKKNSPYRRFKFSSFTRFLQSLIKHPNGNQKQKSSLKPTNLRKYSEMCY